MAEDQEIIDTEVAEAQEYEDAFAEFAGDDDIEEREGRNDVDKSTVQGEEELDDEIEKPTAAVEGEQAPGTGKEAEPTPEVDELTKLREENAKLQQRIRSDDGRVAAHQRKVDQLEQNMLNMMRLQQEQFLGKAKGDNVDKKAEELQEAIDAFKENYPEIADMQQRLLDQQKAALTAEFQRQIDEKLKPVNGAVANYQLNLARETKARAEAAVEEKHAGWKKTVNTDEFRDWMGQQAPGVQALGRSANPVDAITMLDLFRKDRPAEPDSKAPAGQGEEDIDAPPSEADELAKKRQQQLENSVTTRGTRTARRPEVADDYESAFNHFAKKHEKG